MDNFKNFSFREKILKHQTLLGTIVTMGYPAVSEVLSQCGFDWLFIDMEHAPLNSEQVQQLIQAKHQECFALVRVASNNEVWITQGLDLGADGLIIPQIKTAEDARRAVQAAKYPPLGSRSVGMSRACNYGMNFLDYVEKANDYSALIIMIEDKLGVQNIESILQVEGIDAIMIGPFDLSGSYERLGKIKDPIVQDGISKIKTICHQFSKPLGIFALDLEQAKIYLSQGYQLVVVGIDIHYLWNNAKKVSSLLKSTIT